MGDFADRLGQAIKEWRGTGYDALAQHLIDTGAVADPVTVQELAELVTQVKSAEARIREERERIAAAAKRKYGLVIGRGIEEIANVRGQ